MELSILIPARNEEFLGKTIENILENIETDTEVIVVCDGYTTEIPKIPDSPRVKVAKLPVSIGQRAATNLACKLSEAKYVMKIDAHCAFDKGFDRKLIADMHDDWTMVPLMKNLHAFDWVCDCGYREYQGPEKECPRCKGKMRKEIIWQGKNNPQSTAYRFDKNLHFQYWNEYGKRQTDDIIETMSIQGSCFLLTRQKYWELDICDEEYGSWGQQGVEVACKTWLSGGRVVTNKKTWYAHLFRTQPGFSFPYPQSGSAQERARQMSKDIWLNDKWNKATRKFQWLIDKFSPIPGWEEVTKGIVYYTDNECDEKIMKVCQDNLIELEGDNLPVISVSLKHIPFGINLVLNEKRGYLTMAKQILEGLKKSTADIIFFCEHDILYHPSHFDFIPTFKDTIYYNMNSWIVRSTDGFAISYDHKSLSGLCGYRETLIKHYEERIAMIEKEGFSRRMGFEPFTHNRIDWKNKFKCGSWKSKYPNIDIKHGKNLTEARWSPTQFRSQRNCQNWKETDNIEGWGKTIDIIKKWN